VRSPILAIGLSILPCGLLCGLFAGSARAQVGDGWMPYQPTSSIQLDGSAGIESYPGTSTTLMNEGASFTNQDGIETFALHDPISNRAERRMQNTYQTGRRQFEGEVRVSPPTNDESVMQIFGGNSGATTQMIRAYDVGGGTLRKVPGSVVLAENIHGVWVKVNVIHDIGANVVRTYINGRLLATGDGEAVNAGTDGWYHKYGCYGTLRTGSARVEWRNVKHFRDGTAPPAGDGGTPPGSSDGGATAGTADGGSRPDAPSPDTGGGGAGGSGGGGGGGAGGSGGAGGGSGSGGESGSGGSGGSAGRGGRGGSAGSGGSEPPMTPPPPPEAGCSCDAGRAGGGSPLVLLALVAIPLAMRRRRRVS
jgi:MYXO-CTERM domain-containing protein